VKRKSLENERCTVARGLDVVGDWWTLLIVRDALAGVTRFNDFQRSLGAAKNILSSRLKSLVEQGLFEIRPAKDGGPYQEYVLTEKGKALVPVLVALSQWSSDYVFSRREIPSAPVDRRKRRPLNRISLRASDGRRLRNEDVEFLSGLHRPE
jgi:DNA-binding HxlR family transcriptional regulator